jgi:hypothetical protein
VDGGAGGYAHVFPRRLPGTRDLLFSFWGQTFYGARFSAADGTWHPVTRATAIGAPVHLFTASSHLLTNEPMLRLNPVAIANPPAPS